jgi:cytochrome b pre-mRNA-processing protein 3
LLNRLFRKDRSAEDSGTAIYRAVVVQSRQPALYGRLGVPDSVTGRFEMVVLHAVLMLERLRREGEKGKPVSQAVFDDFCRDMDQSLRELGFGDQAVPKRMKQLGENFYGRAHAYSAAAGDHALLTAAIARNVFGDTEAASAEAHRLAHYALAVDAALADVSWADLAAGRVAFPDPAGFAEA